MFLMQGYDEERIVGETELGTPVFDEPVGFSCVFTLVKGNYRNNQAYLEQCYAEWPETARLFCEADKKLSALFPNYNIGQIKEKFRSIRFYIDLPTFDQYVGLDDLIDDEFVSEDEYQQVYDKRYCLYGAEYDEKVALAWGIVDWVEHEAGVILFG